MYHFVRVNDWDVCMTMPWLGSQGWKNESKGDQEYNERINFRSIDSNDIKYRW